MPITGCAYYPEHWPEDRWAQDARTMREAGLSVVRLAEFAWDKMEPSPGAYDFGWLERAIETLAATDLQVVLCTPTPTPPPWLTAQHPDICRVEPDGTRVSPGARRQACANVPAYLSYTKKIVQRMAEHFGQHPAVIGWQVDNEFGCGETTRCHCEHCRARFQDWLRERYGTLEALNAAWGTQFWGMTYRDWRHIPVPGVTTEPQSPSMRLDYYRFASDSWVRFQRMQIDILRQEARGRWVTHNFMIRHWSLDYWQLAADLDFVSYDNYPHGLRGPAEVAMNLDLMHAFKGRAFWVMEQQPGTVNWHAYNPPVPPGQVRLWSHQAVAHGAEAVVYFRYRASRTGQEQYHRGLLKWDGTPDQCYQEAQQVSQELDNLPSLERPPASVGIYFDYNDLWSIELEPHHADFSYWELVYDFYQAAWQAGLSVDFLPRGKPPAEAHQVAILPAAILQRADEIKVWRDWISAGGRLIVTFRSYVRTASNIASEQPLPGALGELAGVRVADYLTAPPATSQAWPHHQPGRHIRLADQTGLDFAYHIWAEALAPTTATPLLTYTDGWLAGQVAATKQAVGQGEIIYLGCWPQDVGALAQALDWWPAAGQTHSLLNGADGRRWRVRMNHQPHPARDLPAYGVAYEQVTHDE